MAIQWNEDLKKCNEPSADSKAKAGLEQDANEKVRCPGDEQEQQKEFNHRSQDDR